MKDAAAPGMNWKGFVLSDSKVLDHQHCLLILKPDSMKLPRCLRYGQSCPKVHDTSLRRVLYSDPI